MAFRYNLENHGLNPWLIIFQRFTDSCTQTNTHNAHSSTGTQLTRSKGLYLMPLVQVSTFKKKDLSGDCLLLKGSLYIFFSHFSGRKLERPGNYVLWTFCLSVLHQCDSSLGCWRLVCVLFRLHCKPSARRGGTSFHNCPFYRLFWTTHFILCRSN